MKRRVLVSVKTQNYSWNHLDLARPNMLRAVQGVRL